MGREAYLTRVVLGRSAFGPPLRDENGEFVLGGQARIHDDQSYTQQWDERGHPQNLTSERRAKAFQKAQNEVLEACGVIIRKDAAKKKKQSLKEVPEGHQLSILDDENKIGFMVKCFDRFHGELLTWWVGKLRMRLTTFAPTAKSLIDSIQGDFHANPASFLLGGFPAWIVAEVGRLLRRSEISEPVECMNYLEFHREQTSLSLQERLREYAEWSAFLFIEIPFEFLSTLQALGFPVLPILWQSVKDVVGSRRSLARLVIETSVASRLDTTILLYLVSDYLHYQLGWRIFGLIRQLTIRALRPTKTSIQAAEQDDFVDDASIIGIGRSLGTHTERRFYGPSSFQKALPVAFPWLSRIISTGMDRYEVKLETLHRCAVMERNEDVYQGPRSITRARNIISNLESLGVDVEEDFFVDVDQWARDIDFLDDDSIEFYESVRSSIEVGAGDDLQLAEDTTIGSTQPNASSMRAELRAVGQVAEEQGTEAALQMITAIEERRTQQQMVPPLTPPTPEVGIRRATSLTQSTPRPVRRPTETQEPDFGDEMERMLSEARRERTPRVKKKDTHEYRMTRLSVFSADSFAWHASSLLTGFILLPLDAIYFQSLAGWFFDLTGASSRWTAVPASRGFGGSFGLSSIRWQNLKMIWLTYGIECLTRGAVWQVGSQIALYYGRRYMWGKF